MISDDKLKQTVSEIFLHGKGVASRRHGLSPDSLDRYVRLARERGLMADLDKSYDRKPQVLVLDVETLPILGTFWRPGKQHLSYQNILEDACLLSYAVKWLFEPDVFTDILTPDEARSRSDKRIMESLWEFVDSADIIIAHNGVRFDMAVINTRLILHRMLPPSPYQIIDTLKIFYRVANFSSNKQGYLNQYLGLTAKMENEGLGLWHKCMNGDQKALDDMLAYNAQDTLGLEDLYVTIRPWAPSHPNMNLYYHNHEEGNVCRCHRCNSKNLTWLPGNKHAYVTAMNRYSSYRCDDCGGIGRARETQLTNEQRRVLTSSVAR